MEQEVGPCQIPTAAVHCTLNSVHWVHLHCTANEHYLGQPSHTLPSNKGLQQLWQLAVKLLSSCQEESGVMVFWCCRRGSWSAITWVSWFIPTYSWYWWKWKHINIEVNMLYFQLKWSSDSGAGKCPISVMLYSWAHERGGVYKCHCCRWAYKT